MKLLVYGEKRQKSKLICLQYATLYSTTQVLLFEIFQILSHGSKYMKDKLGRFQTCYQRYKSLT